MKNKILLIFDWPVTESNAIFQGLRKNGIPIQLRGIRQIIPNSLKNKIKFVFHYFKYCWNLVGETTGKDVLIFRLDMLAIIAWWISILTFRRRQILCINIMLKESSGIKGAITRMAYRYPLKSRNFKATVTSAYFGERISQHLQLWGGNANKLLVLNDDYGNVAGIERIFEDMGNTVFCGGNNGRDWNMLFAVANRMPSVLFKVVMPQSTYDSFIGKVPSNVELLTNLSSKDFFNLQRTCSVTFLPLTTQSPAGLIVLFAAALMRKMVVITDTICTREYLNNGVSGILETTEDEFVKSISQGLMDIEWRKSLGEQACIKIKEIGSPETYINKLCSYIKSFETV